MKTLWALLLALPAAAGQKAVEPLPKLYAQAPLFNAAPLVPLKIIPAADAPNIPVTIAAPKYVTPAAPVVAQMPKLGAWATVAMTAPSVAFDGAAQVRKLEPERSAPRDDDDDERLPPLPPPAKKTYGFPMRLAAASAISISALTPIAQGHVPASTLIYALAGAWTLAVGLETIYGIYRVGRWIGRRGQKAETETRPRWKRGLHALGAITLGLGLGAGLGQAPWHVQNPLLERAAGLAAPELGLRAAGTELSKAALADFTKNPAAKDAAAKIAKLKVPAVFVADLSRLPLRYEPRLHALLVSPQALAERGWTTEQFVTSPDLQRRLAKDLEADAARELYRMAQATNNPLYDGQNLDAGPIEAEQEAVLFEHDYVHAKLKADPRAEFSPAALARYEFMLENFQRGLRAHDGLPEVSRRGYWNAGHYKGDFMSRNFGWNDHAEEAYALLARRAETPAVRAAYLKKASAQKDRAYDFFGR